MESVLNELIQGLSTDPKRLHAELWADYMSKVMSIWLPLVMASVVVGRELFGSGTKCFPIELTDSQLGTNGTLESNISHTPKPALNEISDYSRQLAEYVDIYCTKQDRYESSTLFNYQLFTMMLVLQAAVLYAPVLLWNITTARKIICHMRFLMHDIDLLYHCHRGDHAETRGGYGQSELVKNIDIWSERNTLYKRYIIKQFSAAVFSLIFITFYSSIPTLTASNIQDEFLCSVKESFTVDCAVPSATVHRCVWGANLALLFLNVFCLLLGHIASLQYDHYYRISGRLPFRELGITIKENLRLNDARLIYKFLRANIESIEKYNYVKVLEDVVSEGEPTANTAQYSAGNQANSLGHSPSPGATRRQYRAFVSAV
ncbi:Pannexin-1 [Branchiostoma belcheri]|nr:Pannexin-1 [Branchiostoma belcheri]